MYILVLIEKIKEFNIFLTIYRTTVIWLYKIR